MTRRRSQLKARLGALSMTACLIATQAAAQTSGSGLPTAQDIWRHLPPLPGQAAEPAPVPAPEVPPTPRPERPAAAIPAPSAPVAATPVSTPSVTPRPSPPAVTSPMSSRTLAQVRVVIHYPERGGFQRSEELVRLLRAVGTGEVETRPVRYAVDRQSIRYFHAADRDVSGAIGDMVGGGGRATVSDFTFFRPTPRDGTIEIWLP